jgi:hypothetical protein
VNNVLATLRKAHQALIDVNPVQIQITRRTRGTANGAPMKNEAQLGPIKVRIYEESGLQVSRMQTGLPGTQQRDLAYSLLAPHDADIKADPGVTDEFATAHHGRFRIAEVYPLMYDGQLYGKRAPLERLS